MALPLLAGIPVLTGVLGSLAAGAITFIAQLLTKRLALVTVAVGIIATVTAGFYAAIQALISGIAVSVPAEITQYAGIVCPDNAPGCAAAVISAHFLRWAYDWHVKIVTLKVQA